MSAVNPPILAPGVSLGYGIAISIRILVLMSTIMLASYVCVKFRANTILRNDINNDSDGGSDSGNNRRGLNGPESGRIRKSYLGKSKRLPRPNSGPSSLCLTDYRPNDKIRCVPGCNHCFHVDCVDEWLKMNATCPLCRNSPATTPVAGTPLSDLMPLDFHVR